MYLNIRFVAVGGEEEAMRVISRDWCACKCRVWDDYDQEWQEGGRCGSWQAADYFLPLARANIKDTFNQVRSPLHYCLFHTRRIRHGRIVHTESLNGRIE
jgi:hypothetical protein